MNHITVYTGTITVKQEIGPDVCDITSELNRILSESGVASGSLCASVTGSTGSLTTIEYEPGVIEDLERTME